MFFFKKKISTKNIRKLIEPYATKEKVLVIHSEDLPGLVEDYFPNAFTVTKREICPADMHVDKYYHDVDKIESESYELIICTGLLEHVPEPQKFIDEMYRILKPKGKIVLQASSAFSVHEGPDDFYHFTNFGMERLFDKWTSVETSGSCQPFETIAILLQRIVFQSKLPWYTKVVNVILWNLLPFLDKTIKKQYFNITKKDENMIDSMLPSNMQAIAIK